MGIEGWIQIIAPAITSAGGALIAVKMAYSRIREDISNLDTKMEHLEEQFVGQTIQNAREHGEVKSRLGILSERVENMRAPWLRNTESKTQ